ncbi:MAG: trigger factor [Pseudomonadota bacterium]
MQVSVESTSELTRKVTVRVPEEIIQEKMDAKFNSLARKVKLDGFRPGKVPQHVVKKMFSGQVRSEVIGDLIQSSFFDALEKNDLKPVGAPQITSEEVGAGKGLEYTASFEVYPEVKLNAPEELEIKRPVSEVVEANVKAMVERLRQQRKNWKVVERAVAEHDRVTINFSGSVDGEELNNAKADDYVVVIGSNTMIPGFEDKLVGAKPEERLDFDITFPNDYANEKLSGKSAHFEVEILKVEEPEVPEVDAEFARTFGFENGDVGAFLDDVRSSVEREMNRSLRGRLKTSVMDALYENNPVPLPNGLVDQEIDRLMKPYLESAKKQGRDLKEIRRDAFQEPAKRRVSLGLILGEIIKRNGIKADSKRVRAAVQELAQSYDRPEDVINWYYSNSERLSDVEQMVLEDQVVEWVADRAKVTDDVLEFDALMNPDEQ